MIFHNEPDGVIFKIILFYSFLKGRLFLLKWNQLFIKDREHYVLGLVFPWRTQHKKKRNSRMCALFPMHEELEYTDFREKEYFFKKSVCVCVCVCRHH